MSELNFPPGAMAGTSYVASNGVTYIYDGFKWIGKENASIAAYSLTNNGFTLAVQPTGDITIPNGKSILYENGDPVVTGGTGGNAVSSTVTNLITQIVGSSIISNGTTTVSANTNSVRVEIDGGSYWWNELGNFVQNTFNTHGVGASYDRAGNLWTFGNLQFKDGSFVDAVFAKYDPTGNLLWANQLRDSNNLSEPYTSGTALVFDRTGNPFYVASDLTNNITYVGRLNTTGNIVHQELFSINGYAYDMTFDSGDNICITGLTNDSTRPYSVPFVIKMDQNYNILWQRGIDIGSDSAFGSGASISIDANDNIYITGWYTDPGAGVNDSFLIKLNSSGDIVWQNTIGVPNHPANETGWSIQASNQAIYTLVQDDSTRASVISKFNTSGVQQWQKVLNIADVDAGTRLDRGADISVDTDGFIYVTGSGRILGVQSLWIAKLSPTTGNVIWQRQIAADISNRMSTDASVTGHRQAAIFNNRIAVTGYTDYVYSTSTVSTSTYGFVIQLPTDGSLTGSYNGINYVDVTSLLSASVQNGTYTNLVSSFNTVSTAISTLPNSDGLLLYPIGISTLTNFTQNIATVGSNWIFDNTGTIVFPDSSVQVTAYTGQDPYTPSNSADWIGTPTVSTFSAGLDELAYRTITVESMLQATINLEDLKTIVAASTSFEDFQTRIAAL